MIGLFYTHSGLAHESISDIDVFGYRGCAQSLDALSMRLAYLNRDNCGDSEKAREANDGVKEAMKANRLVGWISSIVNIS